MYSSSSRPIIKQISKNPQNPEQKKNNKPAQTKPSSYSLEVHSLLSASEFQRGSLTQAASSSGTHVKDPKMHFMTVAWSSQLKPLRALQYHLSSGQNLQSTCCWHPDSRENYVEALHRQTQTTASSQGEVEGQALIHLCSLVTTDRT